MAKKVHELAKELGIASKDIVAFLAEKGIDKKPGSNLDENEIRMVNGKFGKSNGDAKKATEAPAEKKQEAKPAAKPEAKHEAKAEPKHESKPVKAEEADDEDEPKRLKPVAIDGYSVFSDGRRAMHLSNAQNNNNKQATAGGKVIQRPVQGGQQRPQRPQQQQPGGQRPQRPQQGSNQHQPVNPQDKKVEIPKGKAPSSSYHFGEPERKANPSRPQPQVNKPVQEQKPVTNVKPEPEKAAPQPEAPKYGQDFLLGKSAGTIQIKGNVFEEQKKREEERALRRQQAGLDSRPAQGQGQRNDRRVPSDRGQGFNRGRDGERKGFTPREGQKPDSSFRQGQGGQGQGGRRFDSGRPSFGGRGQDAGFANKDADEQPSHSYKAGKNDRSSARKPGVAADISAKGNSSSKRNERLAKNKSYDGGRNYDDDALKGSKKKDAKRAGAFQKPVAKVAEPEDDIKVITIPDSLTIKELADKLKKNASEIIKKLFLQGKMVSLNQDITFEEAENIASDYDCLCEHEVKVN
ncbi:MAG: translation initiation factor IF-2 N-terminal domain-containing protein, partial [Lachnospiraceae bacterium]|nr:translation initiation factor IF-2 N-terminal domain-containing protein [Lachnospiraceae bacterium]